MQPSEWFTPPIYTVSEISQYIRALLEGDEALQELWVQGEISNLSRPSSGHIYFTLKDENASLRCVIWKMNAFRLQAPLEDGRAVEAHGSVGVYERGGQYQLYVDDLRPAGEGALFLEFLRLKNKLETEGLFAEERKRPLPAFPLTIGIVTSPTAAALQDILNTLRSRFPLAEVVLSPTAVQGEDAPPQIVAALERINRLVKPDVILLARGGGSLEDLWAFNDERVVRAVVASGAPVVSGIGHETDFTLVDFAADLRAPTPTAAAVLAAPDIHDVMAELDGVKNELINRMDWLLHEQGNTLQQFRLQLEKFSPQSKVRQEMQRIDELNLRLEQLVGHQLQMRRMLVDQWQERATSLDPWQVLKRGYAVVSAEDGRMINTIRKTKSGQRVDVRLQDGSFGAAVEEVTPVQPGNQPKDDTINNLGKRKHN